MSTRIDRIHNYRYPVSQPTVFDEQELTVLELASRNASKTNEIIDLINGNVTDEMMAIIKGIMLEGLFQFAIDGETESLVLMYDYYVGDGDCSIDYDDDEDKLIIGL